MVHNSPRSRRRCYVRHGIKGETSAQGTPKGTTICGIVGVVFGALGLVLSFIPIVNNIAAILGAIGVVLAIIAMVGTFRGKKAGKILSIVAAVLSVLAIVITLAMQSAASKAIDEAINGSGTSQSKSSDAKKSGDDSSNDGSANNDPTNNDSTDTTKASGEKKSGDDSSNDGSANNDPTNNDSTDTTKASGEQDQEGDLKNLHVTIVSAAKSGNDYEDKPTVMVTYEWKNNSGKNNSFAALAHPQVFQNGQALDTAVYLDQPTGYDMNSYTAEIQPGATGKVTLGYVLKDESTITVDVTDLFSIDDSRKVVHTFDLK